MPPPNFRSTIIRGVKWPRPTNASCAVVCANLRDAAGAHDAEKLGDELVLLFEGAYSSAQIFGAAGPAGWVAEIAEALLAARIDGENP